MDIAFSTTVTLPELSLRQPSGLGAASSISREAGDFTGMLRQVIGDASNTVRQGESAALSGIKGELPLQTVVERVMAAERTLQAALAVRDKAVSSYLEVSRMQI